jgi:hypothetical protein
MEFWGYRIERISDIEIKELEEAKKVLEKHGFRAVKITQDKSNKIVSAAKANQAKQAQTNAKIQNALNLWRMEASDEKLTAYKLAQLSGVSQNTTKAFLKKIEAL